MKTNAELREDVTQEISFDPELKNVSTQIGVATKDGVVTLTGEVDNYSKKMAAEKAAHRVLGVKVVASDIVVKIASVGKRSDSQIAEAVKNALLWSSSVLEDKIEVKVDDGWIYLDGKVDWSYQRKSAQRCVEDLIGVAGVVNNLTINYAPVIATEIKKRITEAFNRNANIDASAISVDIHGDRATLRGTVRSWAEKNEAEHIALSSPGVAVVDNKIEISVIEYV